jgi:hypothetical protein
MVQTVPAAPLDVSPRVTCPRHQEIGRHDYCPRTQRERPGSGCRPPAEGQTRATSKVERRDTENPSPVNRCPTRPAPLQRQVRGGVQDEKSARFELLDDKTALGFRCPIRDEVTNLNSSMM